MALFIYTLARTVWLTLSMVLRAPSCLHSSIIIGKLRRWQDGDKRTPWHKKPGLTNYRDMEGPGQLSRLHTREILGASSSEPQVASHWGPV